LVVIVAAIGIFYYNNKLVGNNGRAEKSAAERAATKLRQLQQSNGTLEITQAAKKAAAQAAQKAAKTVESNNGSNCSDGQTFCTVKLTNGKTQGLCISDSSTGGCNGAAIDAGYSVQTGGGNMASSGGWLCPPGTVGQCVGYNGQSIGAGKPPSCFCGIIQIDGGQYDGTYQSTCGCNKSEQTAMETTLVGTIIPTPTGMVTDTPVPTATGTISDTPVPTATGIIPTATGVAPTSTGVPAATLTPVPVLCGTKGCDNATSPCRSGLSCVQASDGSNYCTNPDFVVACKANPSYTACCTAPGSSTPTEIVVAKSTVAPAPVTGNNSWYMFAFPILAIIGGLLL